MTAPEWMREPVSIEGLLPELVLAALYDVARAPGMGVMDPEHSAEPMSLPEARTRIDQAGGVIGEDYTRGRVMKLRSKGGYLDVAAYNRDNADGRPLAQAIIHALVQEFGAASPEMFAGATVIDAVAREAAAEFDLALTWRNTSVHTPMPSKSVLAAVRQACNVGDVRDGFAATQVAWARYPQAVTTWALGEEMAQHQGGDPVAHLEAAMAIWSEIGTPERGPGLDPFLQRLLDTARRETAAGTAWSEMPAAFEATLVEFAVESAARARDLTPRDVPPLGKR